MAEKRADERDAGTRGRMRATEKSWWRERERESGRGEEDEAKSSKVFSKNAASVHELAVIQTSENATPSLTRIARPVIRRRSDRAREHPPSNHRSRADRSPDPAM